VKFSEIQFKTKRQTGGYKETGTQSFAGVEMKRDSKIKIFRVQLKNKKN